MHNYFGGFYFRAQKPQVTPLNLEGLMIKHVDVAKLHLAIHRTLAELGRPDAGFVVIISDDENCAIGSNIPEPYIAIKTVAGALRIMTGEENEPVAGHA